MSDHDGRPFIICTKDEPVSRNVNVNAVQSKEFLTLLLSMVPLASHKGQEERLKKINGLSPTGHGFNIRADQHLEYHHFSEPGYLANGPHCSNLCSTGYDFDSYDYCDGREVSETDAMLQDSRTSGDEDTDALVEDKKKVAKRIYLCHGASNNCAILVSRLWNRVCRNGSGHCTALGSV